MDDFVKVDSTAGGWSNKMFKMLSTMEQYDDRGQLKQACWLSRGPYQFCIQSDLPSCPEYLTRFIKLLTAPIQNSRGLERTFIWTGFNGLYQKLMITRLLSASRLRLVAPLYHLSRWKNSVAIATWQSAPSSTQSYMSSAPLQRSQGYRFSKEKEKIGSVLQDSESDFCSLIISRRLKVDKTMFIREVLRQGYKCTFITRPRGWGKSLNLSMIKYFFGIPIDSRGNITEGKYRPLFEGNLKMGLLPLLISKESQIMKQQGKYPVISLSIPSEKDTHLSFKLALAQTMRRAYNENLYMLDPPQKHKFRGSWEMMQFKIMYQRLQRMVNERPQEAVKYSISNSLRVLVVALHKYHKEKQVIVLADELDGQTNFMINLKNKTRNEEQQHKITAEFDRVMDQLRGLFRSGIQEVKYIRFSLLTGVYSPPLETFYSGFNIAINQGIDSSQFTSSLGYSEQEVEELVDVCLPRLKGNKSQLLKNVKDWYNGYDAVGEGNKKIYNPWSVNCYLNQCVEQNKIIPPKSYRIETGSDEFIKEAFSSAFTNQDLLSKMLALVPNNYPFTREKVDLQMKPYKSSITEFDPLHLTQEGLVYMLYHGGYITGQISRNTSTSEKILAARIPNKEIKKIYQEIFLEIWNKRHQGLAKLDLCSKESFKDTVTGYLKKNISDFRYYYTLANHVVLLVNSNKSVKYEILLEAVAGIERLDHLFIPLRQKSVYVSEEAKVDEESTAEKKARETTMILHEYKYLRYPSNSGQEIIQEALEDAFYQVYGKRYISRLKEQFQKRDYLQSAIIRQVVLEEKKGYTKYNQIQAELHIREQVLSKEELFYVETQVHSTQWKNVNKWRKAESDEARKKMLEKYSAEDYNEIIPQLVEMSKETKSK